MEHWDVVQPIPEKSQSNGMFWSGPAGRPRPQPPGWVGARRGASAARSGLSSRQLAAAAALLRSAQALDVQASLGSRFIGQGCIESW